MSSFDLNKVMLIGNVGKAPLEREFGDNKKLVRFTVATNESWKNKQTGEYDTETQWHNIVCFNQHLCGVILKHVQVGAKVYLEGKLVTRAYRKEGDTEDRYISEIQLPMFDGDIKVLARGKDDTGSSTEAQAAAASSDDPFKDDIPF